MILLKYSVQITIILLLQKNEKNKKCHNCC